MVQITRQDVANIVNTYLRDRLESRISYGSNSYPSDFEDPNYGGNVGSGPAGFNPNVLPAGPIKASAVAAAISEYVKGWGRVRNTQFLSYYNTKGSLSIRQNVTGVTRLASSIALVRTQAAASSNGDGGAGWSVGSWVDPWLGGIEDYAGSPPAANTTASRAGVIDYCTRVFNQISSRDVAGTLRITKTFCHSNCYKAPHSNRGRR